ncbi:hypothetical protein [Kitasatospora kifunensis]|uniref:Circularly permuted ATPgrasp domain-containing protein n=1 Tax=Kitasatospora kifunensis TaxID=58351 RepID=A0A7W7RA18_KITKI|nr:hypothetical protein [Kitasatospora kifunensis]MBB4928210.1 hypothetical protein [Kitasatospora kifunensis]
MDRNAQQQLGMLCARMLELAIEACRRRAADVGQLQELLGAPDGRELLLCPTDPIDHALLVAARPDIVYTAGIPRFVEFNIDGSVGGTLQSDLLAQRFLDLLTPLDPAVDLTLPPSAVDARFAAIRASLSPRRSARVAIPVFRHGAMAGLENPEDYLAWLQPMCDSGRRHGMETIACQLDALAAGERDNLLLAGEPVDAVLRLFLSVEQPTSPGLAALANAARAGTVKLHTSEATWLLSDKTILAWLWEDRAHMTPTDRALIERHVPWTGVFPHAATDIDQQLRHAREHQQQLVLKPTGGYGGGGVVLGPAVDTHEWNAALERAVQQGGHILQHHVTPDSIAMDFIHLETGETQHAEVPYVAGPFMFDRKISTTVIRHGAPGTGAVLNARNGALANTILLTTPGR